MVWAWFSRVIRRFLFFCASSRFRFIIEIREQCSVGLSFDLFSLGSSEDVPEKEETRSLHLVPESNNNSSRKTSATEQLVALTSTALALPPPAPNAPRDLWTNKVEFLLSVIGYVVDLGTDFSIIAKFTVSLLFFQAMCGDFRTCAMIMVEEPFLFLTWSSYVLLVYRWCKEDAFQ